MGFLDVIARENGYSSAAEMKSYAQQGKAKHQEYIDGEIVKGVYTNEQLRALAQKWCNEHAPHDGVAKTTFKFPWGSETFTVDTSKGSWIDKTLNKIGDTFNDRGSDILKGVAVGAATGLLTGGVVGAAAGAVGGGVKGAVGGDLGNILGGVATNGINTAISNDGGSMTINDVLGKVNNGLQSVAGTDIKDIAANVLSGAVTGALTGGSDSAIAGGVAGLANSFGVSGTISGKNGTITVDTGSSGSSGSKTGRSAPNDLNDWRKSYNAATDKIVDSIPIIYGKKGA